MNTKKIDLLTLLRQKYPQLNILFYFPIHGVNILYIIGKYRDYIMPLNGMYMDVPRGLYKRYLKYLIEEVDPESFVAEMTTTWEDGEPDKNGNIPLRSIAVQSITAGDLVILIRMIESRLEELSEDEYHV